MAIITVENITADTVAKSMSSGLKESKQTTGNGFAAKVDQLTDAVNTVSRRVKRFKTDRAEQFEEDMMKKYKILVKELQADAEEKKKNSSSKSNDNLKAKLNLIKEMTDDTSLVWKHINVQNGLGSYYMNTTSPCSFVQEIYFCDANKEGASKFFVYYSEELEGEFNWNQKNGQKVHVTNMIVGKQLVTNSRQIMLSDAHFIIRDKKFVEFDVSKFSKKDAKLMYKAVFDFKKHFADQHSWYVNSGHRILDNICDYSGESSFKEVLQNTVMVD